jgi:hypothetical protein
MNCLRHFLILRDLVQEELEGGAGGRQLGTRLAIRTRTILFINIIVLPANQYVLRPLSSLPPSSPFPSLSPLLPARTARIPPSCTDFNCLCENSGVRIIMGLKSFSRGIAKIGVLLKL